MGAKYVLADGDTAATFLAGFNNNSDQAYALITGVSGGQTIIGSDTTNEDLNLRSNSADLTTGSVNIKDTLDASSKTVGALVVDGGLAVAKKLFAGATTLDSLTVGSLAGVLKGTAGALGAATAGTDFAVGSTGLAGGQTIAGSTLTAESLTLRANAVDLTSAAVIFPDTTDADSKTNGAAEFAGGVAIAKKLFAGATTLDTLLVASDANFTDFPAAKLVAAEGNSALTSTDEMGIVGEAVSGGSVPATGVLGVAKSSGAHDGHGVKGVGKVGATADTAESYGVHGSAADTHAGGPNIGVYGSATNGDTNYSFYGAAGTLYNAEAIQGPKVKLTAEGGIAVLVTAGENLAAGEVVCSLQGVSGADGKVYKCPTSGDENDMPLGVVYANASADASVWIVTSGIASVLPLAAATATRGYVLTASTTTAGRVDQAETVPVAATHFKEVGHWIDDGASPGAAARAIIHFN